MSVSRVQTSPKIDASLLAEYILATPRRREQILLSQRVVSDAPPYFRPADETVCGYLLGIPKQDRAVQMKIEVLGALGAYASDKKTKIMDNIAALEAFLDHPHREFLNELETFPGPRRGSLRVAGVEIVVSPEIIALDATTNSFGYLKLRFSRHALAPAAADYLTSILLAYAQSCASRYNGALNQDLTCVVDVFDGTLMRSSTARAGSWSRVREACAEIAANWALLYERPVRGVTARRRAA